VPPTALGKPGPAAKVHERFAAYTRSEVPATGDGWVVGVPASPGRATGPVRIVTSADQFDLVEPGDVLVAPLTAPAWTPLFARVSAVVTDGGSLAAHASLIAREYGIPAVVATGNATKVLGDGMVVTVDGSQGTIAPA